MVHWLGFEELVKSRHGVGTIVSVVKLPEIRQLYALRLVLTDFVAELPAHSIRNHPTAALCEVREARVR